MQKPLHLISPWSASRSMASEAVLTSSCIDTVTVDLVLVIAKMSFIQNTAYTDSAMDTTITTIKNT